MCKTARYRTLNWPAYNAALRKRCSLTVWFDPSTPWHAAPSRRRGAQPVYSDAAIQTRLTVKVLFGLPVRQTPSFVTSLLKLAGLDWPVPDYSTLCRRQRTLAMQLSYRGTGAPLHPPQSAGAGTGAVLVRSARGDGAKTRLGRRPSVPSPPIEGHRPVSRRTVSLFRPRPCKVATFPPGCRPRAPCLPPGAPMAAPAGRAPCGGGIEAGCGAPWPLPGRRGDHDRSRLRDLEGLRGPRRARSSAAPTPGGSQRLACHDCAARRPPRRADGRARPPDRGRGRRGRDAPPPERREDGRPREGERAAAPPNSPARGKAGRGEWSAIKGPALQQTPHGQRHSRPHGHDPSHGPREGKSRGCGEEMPSSCV